MILNRAARIAASTLIFPDHPVYSVFICESISCISTILNPIFLQNIVVSAVILYYKPTKFVDIINILCKYDRNKINEQTEICCLLIFILTFSL